MAAVLLNLCALGLGALVAVPLVAEKGNDEAAPPWPPAEPGLLLSADRDAIFEGDNCRLEGDSACGFSLRQLRGELWATVGGHLARERPVGQPGAGGNATKSEAALAGIGENPLWLADQGPADEPLKQTNATLGARPGSCSAREVQRMNALGWNRDLGSFPRRLSYCGFGGGGLWSRLKARFRLKRRTPEDAVIQAAETASCIASEVGIGHQCASCFAAAGEYAQENCRYQCLFGAWVRQHCRRCQVPYEPKLKACTGLANIPEVWGLPPSNVDVSDVMSLVSVQNPRGAGSSSSRVSVGVVCALVTILIVLTLWGLAFQAKCFSGTFEPAGSGIHLTAPVAPAWSNSARLDVPPLCSRPTMLTELTDFIVPLDTVQQLHSGVFPAQILGTTGLPVLYAWLPLVGAGGDVYSFDSLGSRPHQGGGSPGSHGFWLQLTAGPTLRRPQCSIGPLPIRKPGLPTPGLVPMEILGPGGGRYGSLEASDTAWRAVYQGKPILTISTDFPFPHLTAMGAGGAMVGCALRKRLEGRGGAEAMVIQVAQGSDKLLGLLCMLAVILASGELSTWSGAVSPARRLPHFGF